MAMGDYEDDDDETDTIVELNGNAETTFRPMNFTNLSAEWKKKRRDVHGVWEKTMGKNQTVV